MGRPKGRSQDQPLQMRVNQEFLAKLDDWRRKQADFPNRTESIRRLVDAGIAAERKK